MGSYIRGAALIAAGLVSAQGAHAWYGPICYSDRTTQLTLTIPSISGESPGDLKVDFDDNDGKVRLEGVRASPSVKNAHEVILVRDAESQNGVFGVMVTSPRSTTGYKFELEFRKDASECSGAIIKATDRAGGGLLAHSAPAAVEQGAAPSVSQPGGMTLASHRVRPKTPRLQNPKPTPSPSPSAAPEESAPGVREVNLDEGAPAPSSDVKPVNDGRIGPDAKPESAPAPATPASESAPAPATPASESAPQPEAPASESAAPGQPAPSPQ